MTIDKWKTQLRKGAAELVVLALLGRRPSSGVALLKRVEARAKSLEPAVEKVSVYWGDADERVMIATLDGRIVTDHRPMTRITAVVTAKQGEETQSGYSNIAADLESSRGGGR